MTKYFLPAFFMLGCILPLLWSTTEGIALWILAFIALFLAEYWATRKYEALQKVCVEVLSAKLIAEFKEGRLDLRFSEEEETNGQG